LYPEIAPLSEYEGEASCYILPYVSDLVIMELRFGVILYSKQGNENSDADHVKCSRGPQVTYPCYRA